MVFYATKGLISPLHNNRQKLKPGQYSLSFSFRHYFKGMCRHNLCNVTEEKKKSLQKLLNIEKKAMYISNLAHRMLFNTQFSSDKLSLRFIHKNESNNFLQGSWMINTVTSIKILSHREHKHR